jgi:ribosomal protein S27E
MKVLRPSCDLFHAECPHCFSLLEYVIIDIAQDYVHCPCCGNWFNHAEYAKPIREGEVNDGRKDLE